MSEELINDLKEEAYTIPGIAKEGKEIIDLSKVMEILKRHLAVPDEKEPEFFNF